MDPWAPSPSSESGFWFPLVCWEEVSSPWSPFSSGLPPDNKQAHFLWLEDVLFSLDPVGTESQPGGTGPQEPQPLLPLQVRNTVNLSELNKWTRSQAERRTGGPRF